MAKYYFCVIVSILILLGQPALAVTPSSRLLNANERDYAKKAFDQVQRGQYAQALELADKGVKNRAFHKYILWAQYQDAPSGYNAITTFIKENDDWPNIKRLQNRAEASLASENLPSATVLKYFRNQEPVTTAAKILLADAKISLKEDKNTIRELVRQAWIDSDFSADQEEQFLNKYRDYITLDDIHDRIDRLLWDDQTADARRLMRKADRNHQRLFEARAMLAKDVRNIDNTLSLVPNSLVSDSGLLYQTVQWYYRKKDYAHAAAIMSNAGEQKSHPDKWWKTRNHLVRELLETADPSRAYQLAHNHGNPAGSADYADAEWLAGWVALRFMGKPREAYEHFYAMYHSVSYPISLSRAAYWAARAADANRNFQIAKEWYKIAAQYPTFFYGQLALSKIDKQAPLTSLDNPVPTKADQLAFQNDELAQIMEILCQIGQYKTAEKFAEAAIDRAKTPGHMALIASIGKKYGYISTSVIASRRALRQNVVLAKTGYPTFSNMPKEAGVEPALALGITLQESRFDPYAKSPANATGLMQLLPSTAKRVAHKHHIRYKASQLQYSSEYNMLLGTYYLSELLDIQDNSYILTIASYNAGPGNVRQWLRRFGDPRKVKMVEEAVDWLELVPFYETRNYIQRVMENKQVYQYVTKKSKLTIEDDLIRGFLAGS